MSRTALRTTAVTVALVAAGVASAAPAVAAPAPPAPKALKVTFDAVGTSQVATIDSTVRLGPASLITKLFADGHFAGKLHLPPARVVTTKLGPGAKIAALLTFIPAAPVTGNLRGNQVSASSSYILQLSNLTLGGVQAGVGDNCKTVDPVVIALATPPGQTFDINGGGGTVTGTYTIGDFANCGGLEGIISSLASGGGNTATVALSNGHIATE